MRDVLRFYGRVLRRVPAVFVATAGKIAAILMGGVHIHVNGTNAARMPDELRALVEKTQTEPERER